MGTANKIIFLPFFFYVDPKNLEKIISKRKFSENNFNLFKSILLVERNITLTKTPFLRENCNVGLEIGVKIFRKT
jgi:hypothetical protein